MSTRPFDAPWALEFLPGTESLLLVTERTGALKLRSQDSGEVQEIRGAPEVVDSGQGGLHDVIAGDSFEKDRTIYLSWERSADEGTQGVAGRAQLDVDQARLENLEMIWEQDPASGNGHFALRMLLLEDLLYVTSGDRQEMDAAQDEGANYGWPEASQGVHYDGTDISEHAGGDGFEAPKAHWVPAISPANLMIYPG